MSDSQAGDPGSIPGAGKILLHKPGLRGAAQTGGGSDSRGRVRNTVQGPKRGIPPLNLEMAAVPKQLGLYPKCFCQNHAL